MMNDDDDYDIDDDDAAADDDDLKSEISSNEDKNILSSVRFSRLVDSRRISKDYYALLQKEQEKYAPNYLLT